MKSLNYSLLCEDIAQKTFIEGVLPLFFDNQGLSFDLRFNQDFFYRFKCRNSKDVLNRYVNAGIVAVHDFNIELLLIGVDYDDRDRKKFNYEIEILYNEFDPQVRANSVIFFPVQAIEHWLLLIYFKSNNPKSTKNISNDIERLPRKSAKVQLFGASRPSKIEQKQRISEIIKQIDVNWLTGHSQSFRRFNNDLIKFFAK
ncbi:MAG: hypothetical protein DRJ05_12995 [Bacteroidetes bacterium]|nr:MAG: hypothetical protein DRJ05_12995 [Bacteroidota bacterium]